MRPISKYFVAVVLVGCFAVAVAVAGEPECDGPYKGHTLTPEDLARVLSNHQAWLGSSREPNDPRKANLCRADLLRADLQEAFLQGADLRGALLYGAHLQEAHLSGADLQKARLSGAHLQGANLYDAHLQEADLSAADLEGAYLLEANLRGAVYEPNPEKLPKFWTLTHPHNNLGTLVFHDSPVALIALREAFKKGGMRTQERQLTYAIEHTKQLHAWDQWDNPPGQRDTRSWLEKLRGKEDKRPWLEMLAGKSESLFSYVLFELPSAYGMAPGRALWGLLGLIPIFALPYWLAIKRASNRHGIWMILPEDRLASRSSKKKVVLLRPPMAKTWRERLVGEVRILRTGFYFSVLSAFHLGWRELNVGTWIARLQFREYTLRATGWVRMVSGIQSLISVYLLALWVLTYFGRPFE
jgi:hypothetical protein